jgi:hypothetical protein
MEKVISITEGRQQHRDTCAQRIPGRRAAKHSAIPRFPAVTDLDRIAERRWRVALDLLGAAHSDSGEGFFVLTAAHQAVVPAATFALATTQRLKAARTAVGAPGEPETTTAGHGLIVVGSIVGTLRAWHNGVSVAGVGFRRCCQCSTLFFVLAGEWWGCVACGADSRETEELFADRVEPWPYAQRRIPESAA